ncbi:MAG: zinc-dependent peptidase [Proteobacteria bacterium]|nr:zinc-dependent peptidase [Pseudomonadota bacterium]
MSALYLLLFLIAIAAIALNYRKWRIQYVLSKPFPASWEEVVERRLPFFRNFPVEIQQQLLDRIQLFISRMKFYGCNGQEINDEIRVTIAAEACLLLLNRETRIYPSLRYILVYPSAFKTNSDQHNPDGTVSRVRLGMLGQSWSNGKIILSWDDVEHGIENFHDGNNVVLHEFAHQLDGESGSTNGAPRLIKNSYQTWAKTLSGEFEALVQARDHHLHSVMDYYGSTNPAEFFAVCTETFFEKPKQLSATHPELFGELKTYYCVDPRLWL